VQYKEASNLHSLPDIIRTLKKRMRELKKNILVGKTLMEVHTREKQT